jgi:hypothetical protein
MKQSNTSRFAYFAGLLDGEGTIGIYCKNDMDVNFPGNGRGLSSYKAMISICQKRGPMIDWLYGNFGGTIYKKSQVTVAPNTYKKYEHEMYEWKLTSYEQIVYILKRALPFLTEKKNQAELMIEFIHKHNSVKQTGIKKGFILEIPKDVLENWKRYAEETSIKMKELKRNFVPCAAVETKLFKTSTDVKL